MPESNTPATAVAPDYIDIEVVAWVTKFVGGNGSDRKVFREVLQTGDTVRQVLRRLSGRFAQLHRALWDPDTGDLAQHIEVLVNDAVLDVTHTLDSPLHSGDQLSLIGQYLGG